MNFISISGKRATTIFRFHAVKEEYLSKTLVTVY